MRVSKTAGPMATTGAEAVLSALVERLGACVVFANPGTSEMNLVAALDLLGALRPVLVLQENVATGAADGFARMTGAESPI